MGEAWFMGAEREMYAYLLDRPVEELSERELEEPLREIASGNSCFGPMREWKLWLDYLVSRLVPVALRAPDRRLQEILSTAVMAQYNSGFDDAPYAQFGEDVLATLGQCVMGGNKWEEGRPILEHVLFGPPSRNAIGWGWWAASGDLSSSLFLCLKYLAPPQIGAWAESVLSIPDPHWRAQMLVWLSGARRILVDGAQPKDICMQSPEIDWAESHVLSGNYTGDYSDPRPVPLVAEENSSEFRKAVQRHLTPTVLADWRESIAAVDYLADEAWHLVNSADSEFLLSDEG
jgi:hypothetical protein